MRVRAWVAGCVLITFPAAARAQHDMAAHHAGPLPTQSGQSAFAAISEIVRMLEADPKTDWAKVNLEALRQHLIDMDDVTLRARVQQRNVPGGFEASITGTGRTAEAIKRIVPTHAAMLEQDSRFHARTVPIGDGVRLTVTAKNASDAKLVTQVRGLGFAGIMTENDHHAMHHLAIAKGDKAPHAMP